MTPAITHLLYLHGFRSSPQSTKARTVAQWVREHRPDLVWLCPQLPPSPGEVLGMLKQLIAHWPRAHMAIVGSSLGGFYATVLAEELGCHAVLLNPAVNPSRDLVRHIGQTTAWHSGDAFHFRPEFVDQLRVMTPAALTSKARYFAVVAKGDEVLDWREMSQRYSGCHIKLLEGSDHAITDFDEHLPEVMRFLGLTA